jgi:hypothetical protein
MSCIENASSETKVEENSKVIIVILKSKFIYPPAERLALYASTRWTLGFNLSHDVG